MATGEYSKLIAKIKKADGTQKKTKIWQDADLTRDQSEQVVREMILSLPKGYYKLNDRQYGTNLRDTMYNTYGWMPSMLVSEQMMLGLQALHEKEVYASFTHGLDTIELKSSPAKNESKEEKLERIRQKVANKENTIQASYGDSPRKDHTRKHKPVVRKQHIRKAIMMR